MHRFLSVSLPLSLVCMSSVGCVSYKTWKQTKDALEQAKIANDDLVKKYNQAIQELMKKEKPGGGVDQEEYNTLQTKYNDLLKTHNPSFAPEDAPPGASIDKEGGIQLGEDLLFDEGSDRLKPTAYRTLDSMVNVLRGKYPDDTIIIEGHTDNQPLKKTKGLYETNMTLGYKRAYAVFKYFSDHTVPESRMIVHTYSFNKPIDPATADTKDGRRQNRRVVVRRGSTQI